MPYLFSDEKCGSHLAVLYTAGYGDRIGAVVDKAEILRAVGYGGVLSFFNIGGVYLMVVPFGHRETTFSSGVVKGRGKLANTAAQPFLHLFVVADDFGLFVAPFLGAPADGLVKGKFFPWLQGLLVDALDCKPDVVYTVFGIVIERGGKGRQHSAGLWAAGRFLRLLLLRLLIFWLLRLLCRRLGLGLLVWLLLLV